MNDVAVAQIEIPQFSELLGSFSRGSLGIGGDAAGRTKRKKKPDCQSRFVFHISHCIARFYRRNWNEIKKPLTEGVHPSDSLVLRTRLIPIEGGEERVRSGTISKSFAEVGETIDISGGENEAAAELEGILAKFVLLMAGGAGALAALKIVAAKKVKQIAGRQVGDGIRLALFIYEQRKSDAGFFTEKAGVVAVAKADGGERSAPVEKGLLVFAQLRDVLAAKDSAVVAKKNDDGGFALPQRTKADFPVVGVGENDVCKLLTESLPHGETIVNERRECVKALRWPLFRFLEFGCEFVSDFQPPFKFEARGAQLLETNRW
jgi:hypothetical protein